MTLEHEYPHDHWCDWRNVYVKAEDENQRLHAQVADLKQQVVAYLALIDQLQTNLETVGLEGG